MTLNIKKVLLTGTAIIAVGAFGIPSSVQAQTAVTAAASGTWSSNGTNLDDGTLDEAEAGADLDITGDGALIFVSNDGVADDSGGLNNFTIGTITDSSSAQDVDLILTSGSAANLNIAITSATLGGGVFVDNFDADDADVTVDVTGNVTIGDILDVVNTDTNATTTVTLDIDGNLVVVGASSVIADTGTGADANANLDVAGNVTFTGGLTLDDNGGTATFNLDGSTAQAVTGVIDGDTANEGAIVVSNTSGATFFDAVGGTTAVDTILVAGTGANAEATFRAAVSATSITLGDGAGTDSNSVTFRDATGFTVTGTVDGTAGDTDTVVVSGGGTIVQASAWGGTGVIDSLAVSGSGTEFDSDAALTVTTAVVGSGATLDVGVGLLTGDVTLSGTVNFTGTGGMTGNITGASGTVDVDEDVTLTGDITNLNSVTVATTKTLDIDHSSAGGAVSATTVTLEGAGATLNLDSDASTTTVTGDIRAGAASTGVITIQDDGAGTTAFVGNIGTNSVALSSFTIGGGNNNIVTTTGNMFVDTIVVDDADSLRFVGTSAQSVSGTINGVGAGDGDLQIGFGGVASDVTFNDVIGGGNPIATATVDTVATARYNANAIFSGAYTNSGTTVVGVGAILNADSLSDTGTYTIQANDADGVLTNADFGGLTDSSNDGTLTVTNLSIDVTGNMTEGTAASVFSGINPVVDGAISDNSAVFSFAAVTNGTDTDIDVVRTGIGSVTTTANADNVAAIFDSALFIGSTDTQIGLINDQIASAGNATDLEEVLEATTPTVDGGAVVGGFNASTESLSVAGARLASLREGDAATGVAAGNYGGRGLKAWGQVFGSTAEQDDRDGIDGYEAGTYGIAAGFDSEGVLRNTVLGLGLSYAQTEVDSDNANNTETELDSYQVTLYGEYDFDERTYFSGMLAYAYNEIDQQRFNVGGVGSLTADADFDSDQIIVYSEIGHDYDIGRTATITPHMLAHYQHIQIDGYTETGAGGANLIVDTDDMDIFEVGVGAKVEWIAQNSSGSHIKPSIYAEIRHDLIGDEVESSSTFQAGGASFSTVGVDPAETSYNVGAALAWYSKYRWDLTAAYDFTYKEDYDSHSGFLRAGYRF